MIGADLRANLLRLARDPASLVLTFVLPPTDVDKLKDAGHRLLRQNPAYRELLRDLKIQLPPEPADPKQSELE